MKRISAFATLLLCLFPSATLAQERAVDPILRQLTRPDVRDAIRRTPRLGAEGERAEQPFGGTVALERPAGARDARVGVLVRLASPAALDELRAAGAEVGVVVGGIATAWVPVDAIERVSALRGLERIEAARALTTEHDSSMIAIRADGLRQLVGGTWTGAAGQGVLIGIYDTGLDLLNEDFRDPAGRTRVVAVWDQISNAQNPPPGFTQGFHCTREAVQRRIDNNDTAACPQIDNIGHGTHVTGTAAGDGSAPGSGATQFHFAGVAPAADLVIVRGGPGVFFENLIVEGLVFMRALASSRNQPMVVNLSLSGQFGPHDGSRLYEQVMDSLSGPGFMIVISAANVGSNRNTSPQTPERLIHARGVPAGTQPADFAIDICSAATDQSCTPFTQSVFECAGNSVELDFWYEADDRLRIEVIRPSGSALSAARGQRSESADANGRIVIDNGASGPSPENGDVEALIIIDDCGVSGVPQFGTWRVRVTPEVAGSGRPYDMWIYRSAIGLDGLARGRAGFDNHISVGSPGNSARAITVGAYATKLCWPSQGASGQSCYVQQEQLGDIARFSAAGPRRDGVLKPELAAPGIGVVSSRSRDVIPALNRLLPDNAHWVLEGTSMSAPHVTGAVAILLQARRDMRPEEAKALFQRAAINDGFTGRVYGTAGSGAAPSDWWGYGKLNVRDALFALTGTTPATLTISAAPARPDSVVVGRDGNRLPLLQLTLESSNEEAIDVIGVSFDVTGRDPAATLLLVRDANRNGAPDAGEPVLGSAPAVLNGGKTRVQVEPDSLRVPQGGEVSIIVAIELSGQAPHGSVFEAELIAAATVGVGTRSLAHNPLEVETVVASGPAGTSVLRSDELMSLSENPVRGASVLFHFAETPTTAAVYTVSGRRVVDLLPTIAGNRAQWDLTNAEGARVAPGVYLVVFSVSGQTFREKMIILTPGGETPGQPE